MTKQFVFDNTMWVIKYTAGREALSGKEIDSLQRNANETFWDNVRDIDLLAVQPDKDIQALVDEYERLEVFMTWPEYINSLVKKGLIVE